MTKDNIIRMAREAGLADANGVVHAAYQLEAFTALVAAHKTEVITAEAYRCGYKAGMEAAAVICENLPVQEPDRRALQAEGKHPAPCARHCEAKAFEIEIRSLNSRLKQQQAEPPQREWQGLTDEAWVAIDNKKGTALDTFTQGAVWAESQLRERNT